MSNYNNLKTTIDANIKQNGNQEITGPILNSVLNQMVNILGTGYQFAGVATLDPATDPGTPDAKVFYIANGKGTYTNFGGLEVTEDDVVVLYWDTAWHKVATGIASQAKLSELEEKTDAITREDTIESDDAIIYESNKGHEIGRIDESGADFQNLKSNGKPVLVEDVNETDVEDQEVLFSKDDDSEVYAKVGEYGVKSKAFLDLDGNPLEGAKSRRDNTIYFGGNDPINKISESLGFASMFEDWGFIGDSLTSGYIAVDNVGAESPLKSEGLGSIGRNIYRMSWGQILCRMCGTKGTNFSLGGATTASWLSQFANGATNVGYNSDGTIGVNFLSQKKSVYTICLGTNDSGNNIPVGNVETDIDLTDYHNNANTFAGNYAKIIQMCKEMTPSCKIFLITPFKWWSMGAESKGYNSIVRQLTTLFSKVYLIDLYNYGISSANDYVYQAHCNTQGYTYVAYVIADYIDYIIRNHPEDFKYHCLIPSLKEGMDNGNY